MLIDSADSAHQHQDQEVSLACCLLFPKENGRILKTIHFVLL